MAIEHGLSQLKTHWSLQRSSVLHYLEREVKHLEYFEKRKEFRAQEREQLEHEKLMKKTVSASQVTEKKLGLLICGKMCQRSM